jgi:hypothetical protein
MRKFILNLHMYGGLLCSAYLLVFGFSSLNFNHHFGFAMGRNTKVTWEEPLPMELVHDNIGDAESVRDRLGLMGWTPPWEMSRDNELNFHFQVTRPGKNYTIHALQKEGKVKVEESRAGFWPVVNSLHALGGVPGSAFSRTWGWYTEVCTVVVLFSAGSGVWLWAISKRERSIGTWTLVAALTASLGYIAFMIWRG